MILRVSYHIYIVIRYCELLCRPTGTASSAAHAHHWAQTALLFSPHLLCTALLGRFTAWLCSVPLPADQGSRGGSATGAAGSQMILTCTLKEELTEMQLMTTKKMNEFG